MYESSVLQQLIKLVNNAKKLKIEYGVTGQEVNKDNNNIITFSSNTTMEVNYSEKKGSIVTVRGDFSGTYTTKEIFENNSEKIIKKDSNTNTETSYVIEYSEDDYEKLFNPGGRLHPLQVEELIPVDSQMNNKKCQVCSPSKVITDSIQGHIKSTYAIYQKDENYYDVTMIMSQLDKELEVPLMQYCNTKIYAI
ncbi:MAG: hypothetical protein E6356_03030 [Terrisporobacter othiniensis]|uniref:Uncharacterized protein n=1 Tax=Terrisporobacter hibernicus TaxID=2813371 RepID=A0AAX2ZBS3_9FIRM|nr:MULTISPECIES: hypothetical protein [Terrisporobacter]MBN9646654.1 hypothetical protein [Terrisporobacter glycolicus]MDU4859408.1 hypothetical protein [Terrisporobacter othiniensis]MDU6993795.1 hypothetical protein [Terrisporobacter othiniensis]UEL46698.1 hypothetical protein JW646_13760 [Terrisporobacter hibernicus]SFI99628.1 hypothetical protein SAMN02910355_0503 [Terrisporobacter glycolicus]